MNRKIASAITLAVIISSFISSNLSASGEAGTFIDQQSEIIKLKKQISRLKSSVKNKKIEYASCKLSLEGPSRAMVKRVSDGDTIALDSGETVRLLLINTPEIVHKGIGIKAQYLGVEVGAYVRNILLGKKVRLSKGSANKDRFGRLLRYVYVKDEETGDEIMINRELIRNGFAWTMIYDKKDKYVSEFQKLEIEACISKLGIWENTKKSECPK